MVRMRKIVARDAAGNLYRYELGEDATIENVQQIFLENSHLKMPHGALVTDPVRNRILDKNRTLGDVAETEYGEINFLILPDTVCADGR